MLQKLAVLRTMSPFGLRHRQAHRSWTAACLILSCYYYLPNPARSFSTKSNANLLSWTRCSLLLQPQPSTACRQSWWSTPSSSSPSRRLSPLSSSTQASSVSSYSHLPRIHVETNAKSLGNHTLVELTPSQIQYLHVMRWMHPKRWGDWVGHVRIFNGHDGEWLARCVVMADSSSSSTSSTSSSNTMGRNRNDDLRRKSRFDHTNGGGGAVVTCIQQLRVQPDRTVVHRPTISLWMTPLKKVAQKIALEKVTELGVDQIQLVETQYTSNTNQDWDPTKQWAYVIEASEQCERLTIPILSSNLYSFSNLLEVMKRTTSTTTTTTTSTTVATTITTTATTTVETTIPSPLQQQQQHQPQEIWWIGRERSSTTSQPLLQALSQLQDDARFMGASSQSTTIHLVIGPEGGWSPDELTQLEQIQQDQENVRFISLGSTVLRAETAAMTAIATVMLYYDAQSSFHG